MWVTEVGMRTNRCLYPVTGLGWNLVSPKKSADQEGGREKPNDWLGPQNGSGDPFPSAEIDSKKEEFLSRVRSGRTNHSHFTPGGRQKNY